jgi:hypothetical protein
MNRFASLACTAIALSANNRCNIAYRCCPNVGGIEDGPGENVRRGRSLTVRLKLAIDIVHITEDLGEVEAR